MLISNSYLHGDLFAASPLTVACTLGDRIKLVFDALVDTGATGHCFIDEATAQDVCDRLEIEPQRLLKAKNIRGFDGKPGTPITHAIYPTMKIHDHIQTLTPMLVTRLGNHPIILGKPWMNKHHVILDMATDELKFGKHMCVDALIAQALRSTIKKSEPRSGPARQQPRPRTGTELGNAPPQAPTPPLFTVTPFSPTKIIPRPSPPRTTDNLKDSPTERRKKVANCAPEPWQPNLLHSPTPQGPEICKPPLAEEKKEEKKTSRNGRSICTPAKRLSKGTRGSTVTPSPQDEEPLDICEVSPIACKKFTKRPGVEVFIIYLHEMEE